MTAHGQAVNGQTEQDVHALLRQGVDGFAILDTESRIGIAGPTLYGPVYRRFCCGIRLSDEQQRISDVFFTDYYHRLSKAAEKLEADFRQHLDDLPRRFQRDVYADIEIGGPEFEALPINEQRVVRLHHRHARNPDFKPPMTFASPAFVDARNDLYRDQFK